MKGLFLITALLPFLIMGQEKPLKDKVDSSSYYFKKAVLLSACLPGAGQVYNSIKMKKCLLESTHNICRTRSNKLFFNFKSEDEK